MGLKRIAAASYRSVPWNNGGGTTADVDVVSDAAGMLWRVSIATIERNGPFSDFAGYDRTIVPLGGGGFVLEVGGGPPVRLAETFQPYAFDGGANTMCRLLGGSTRALNVMTARASHVHALRIHELTAPVSLGACDGVRYIVTLSGVAAALQVQSEPIRVEAGDTLRVDDTSILSIEPVGPQTVVASIRITPRPLLPASPAA